MDDATRAVPPADPDETRLSDRPNLTPSSRPSSGGSSSGWLSSSDSIDHGRFEPGSLLGGRYRIVGRLGHGGMGEVYRADDLKLGQPVALKFLPPDVDRDPARLTQLHTEVRMARQVSHPNVCRVYDIDEVDGHTFLSMEYVDGEDLASLLKRVGRFPEERGLEIARQICAGLAAAHERGVIHRDLKPANVMIDGSGRVRLTDFGLAGLAGETLRAGTPAYMAPEQLSGSEVTARSDVYALGLVLYETFTGRRALEGKNLAELIRIREQSGIVPPTAIVKDLSPDVERAIMRCLRPEPEARPASAIAVSASLPGGDPLAAALAAGETPSPEMVAAAGSEAARFNPFVAGALFTFVVVGLLAMAAVANRILLVAHIPFEKPAAVLEDRAKDIMVLGGYARTQADQAGGFGTNGDLLSYLQRSSGTGPRLSDLNSGDLSPLRYWYRTSPLDLVPLSSQWAPTPGDPPQTTPGMVWVVVDGNGQLTELVAVPSATNQPSGKADAQVDWGPIFDAAGLRFADFVPAAPQLPPPRVFADRRAAWEGPLKRLSDVRVRVETASFEGRPVFFTIVGPWTRPPRFERSVPSTSARIISLAGGILGLLLLFGAAALARYNVRRNRSDWRGATRVSLILLIIWTTAWILGARHYSNLSREFDAFLSFFAFALLNTARIWVMYLALEPYVRRYCPDILISWTRLLAGGFRDERVGRDLLAGIAIGVFLAVIVAGLLAYPTFVGGKAVGLRSTNLLFLAGSDQVLSSLLRILPSALRNAVTATFVYVIVLALVRRPWVAVIVALSLFTAVVMNEIGGASLLGRMVYALIFVVPVMFALLRFGVLTQVTALLVNSALSSVAITLDLSKPYAATGAWLVLVIVALAAFALHTSWAGKRIFGRLLEA